MANKEDLILMAHLMRRAGFGAYRDELEGLVEQGYEATVEQLLHPENQPEIDEHVLSRFHSAVEIEYGGHATRLHWLYHMVNTQRPLQEKMTLFWHHVFATALSKVAHEVHMLQQLQMFRDYGMGSYRDLLVQVAKNPAMIVWLDNNENHRRAPNENWGRELLELFSLGVGNYTEDDVYECSRAFTGWTVGDVIPQFPYGSCQWQFKFRAEDHDFGEKTFLGHTGHFDGEDIIDIIVRQPACAKFVSRLLYNFFVADEPPVSMWSIQPPQDPEAIEYLAETFVDAGYKIKPVLSAIFNSDFFKGAQYRKVKSPLEVVVGTLRFTQNPRGPDPRLPRLIPASAPMGQTIIEPPSVEGWGTGKEWIYTSSLVERVNFVSENLCNTDLPGVRSTAKRIASNGTTMSAEALVDCCLDELGPLAVTANTRHQLVAQVESGGPVTGGNGQDTSQFARRVGETMALIAATREYQWG